MGRATSTFFCPAPWSGVKNHLISIIKTISKIFYQTLCVFSQMKDRKHIRRDFLSVPWVMLQGWDFGVPRGQKLFFFKHGHVAYQIDKDDEQNRMQVKFCNSSGSTQTPQYIQWTIPSLLYQTRRRNPFLCRKNPFLYVELRSVNIEINKGYHCEIRLSLRDQTIS